MYSELHCTLLYSRGILHPRTIKSKCRRAFSEFRSSSTDLLAPRRRRAENELAERVAERHQQISPPHLPSPCHARKVRLWTRGFREVEVPRAQNHGLRRRPYQPLRRAHRAGAKDARPLRLRAVRAGIALKILVNRHRRAVCGAKLLDGNCKEIEEGGCDDGEDSAQCRRREGARPADLSPGDRGWGERRKEALLGTSATAQRRRLRARRSERGSRIGRIFTQKIG